MGKIIIGRCSSWFFEVKWWFFKTSLHCSMKWYYGSLDHYIKFYDRINWINNRNNVKFRGWFWLYVYFWWESRLNLNIGQWMNCRKCKQPRYFTLQFDIKFLFPSKSNKPFLKRRKSLFWVHRLKFRYNRFFIWWIHYCLRICSENNQHWQYVFYFS